LLDSAAENRDRPGAAMREPAIARSRNAARREKTRRIK